MVFFFVSSLKLFPGFPFSCPISDFYFNILDLYAKIPYCVFSTCSTLRGARVGGGVGWGSMGGVEAIQALYAFLIRGVV